jgi:hypothetical protein
MARHHTQIRKLVANPSPDGDSLSEYPTFIGVTQLTWDAKSPAIELNAVTWHGIRSERCACDHRQLGRLGHRRFAPGQNGSGSGAGGERRLGDPDNYALSGHPLAKDSHQQSARVDPRGCGHRRHGMVDETLHEHAPALSEPSQPTRSRSCPSKCAKDSGHFPAHRRPWLDTRTLQAFIGHRSIADTVVYTAVADKRIRNIWGKQARRYDDDAFRAYQTRK